MTRLFLGACVLTFGLVFGLAGCDGVGTSPDEISEDDSTAAANALRPSPKDSSTVPNSLTQVEPGDTLTIPIKAVAEMPEDTSRGGSLEFDSVSVMNSDLPVDTTLKNSDRTLMLMVPPDSTGEFDVRFRPAYGAFVSTEMGTLPVMVKPNQPPTAMDDSDMTTEGDTTTTEVLDNDTDPDGSLDSSTVAVQSGPSDGSASANADGTITYGPNSGFTGEDSYTYTVADDDGATSNEATVTITEEDNDPQFTETGPFSVSETASNGTEVGEVNATDGDGGNNDVGVTYQITEGNDGGALTIAEDSGVLTVADSSAIDFEKRESDTLTVEADDGTNTETVEVMVNVGDEAPTISVQTIGPVKETAGKGAEVGTVTSGGDQSSVEYTITDNVDPDDDGTGAFEIEKGMGVVKVSDSGDLDYEGSETLDIKVGVNDDTSDPDSEATVTVEVEDEAPTILNQTIGPVPDTAKVETEVDTVTSGGDQSSVEYTITGNADPDEDGTDAFGIKEEMGVVTVADPGDLNAPDTLDITVEVTDGTTSDDATVTITVESTGSSSTSDIYKTGGDSALKTSMLGVPEDDSGPDGGVLGPSAVAVRSDPSDGLATAKDNGTITPVPDERPPGTALHDYAVENSEGKRSNGATVTAGVSLPLGR